MKFWFMFVSLDIKEKRYHFLRLKTGNFLVWTRMSVRHVTAWGKLICPIGIPVPQSQIRYKPTLPFYTQVRVGFGGHKLKIK